MQNHQTRTSGLVVFFKQENTWMHFVGLHMMQVNDVGKSATAKKALAFADGGFTLIELIASVVIVGILATIALPSYLNQAAKARGSEAKAALGAINRSQQSYRWERGVFADNVAKLDLRFNGKFYSYSIVSSNATDTVAITTAQEEGLRVSSGAVTIDSGAFKQIICESQTTEILNASASLPTGGGGTPLDCPGGYRVVE
ncbi:MAG: prepilin-type N-terminal cleavage/methylation domain-containing protein [Thermosynechococcaceae cyanobacterium MS004]|nr:prepilin-type N-terminal cleavage/methylation domain-containing protein [Thermosynechococcaceae cyanobacterium MS004]